MLPKIGGRRFGVGVSAVLPLLVFAACSGADSAPSDRSELGEVTQPIGVAIANGCAVFWDKINYDTPANGDEGELIELRVVKSAGSTATTLGQCGLAALVLVNGSNCQPYATINLANVAIPNDGFVQICDTAWNPACDVDQGQGWLQNDNEALYFVGPGSGGGPVPLLHASWEGTGGAVCLLPDAGNLPTIIVPTETNASPDQISVWCPGGFQLRAAASAGLGMAYTCAGPDAGTDAGPDAPPDSAAGGSGGGNTGGTGGAATGGTGGTATGGSGGTATGGTGGAATGGSGGTATGGTGGAATGGSGGTATGGTGGAATGGSGGTATGGTGGAATGGTGGAATGGSGGAATGGAAGTGGMATGGAAGTDGGATGGAAGTGTGATGGSAGSASGGAAGSATGGGGSGGSATGGGGSGATASGGSGAKDAGVGGKGADDSGDDGGCGCQLPGSERPSGTSVFALLGALLFASRRRRHSRNSTA